MTPLAPAMPFLRLPAEDFQRWGALWLGEANPETGQPKSAASFDRQQSVNFASFIDEAFANALATMLGGLPVEHVSSDLLVPRVPDCVEIGAVRIIGGIRPQNFDVAYRPDGVRVAFDSKTLNDLKSVGKNWQNMVNDLATEAATVHTRFPYALVAFIVAIPKPALGAKQQTDIVRTLERLGSRRDVLDQLHLAEAIALVVWDPKTGEIDAATPAPSSNLRIEKFPGALYPHYLSRYKGLPPHDA